MKLDYTVKVYVGGSDVVPSIGLTGGVCTWVAGGDILTENWCSSFGESVDISLTGNYAKFSDVTINIVKSAIVRTTLKNYNLKLENSRLEIFATDGITTELKWRGVISRVSDEENVTSIVVSHVANFYATDLSPSIGNEKPMIVIGESVNDVKLIFDEPEAEEPLTIGDGLLPVFVVHSNDQSEIFLRSVYDESIIDESQMIDFWNSVGNESGYIKVSQQNALVGNIFNTFYVTISTIKYYGIKFIPIPMNAKDGAGNWFLPVGAEVIVEKTSYAKLYFPYGSAVDPSKLTYKDGNLYKPFPEYIDSRVDFDDRIEILDSDDTGYTHKSNIDQYVYRTSGETRLVDGLYSFIGGNSINLTNGDNFTERGTGSFFAECSNTVSPNISLFQDSITFVQNITFGKIFPDKLFSTGILGINTTGVPNVSGTEITVIYRVIVKTLKQEYTSLEETYSVPINLITSYINTTLPTDITSEYEQSNFRIGSNNKNGQSIDLFAQISSDWEKQAPITIRSSVYFLISRSPQIGQCTIGIQYFQLLAESAEYDAGDIYIQGSTGKKDNLGVPITALEKAYINTLRLQNYTSLGYTAPAKGWGLDYIADYTNAIDPSLDITDIPLQWKTKDVNTRDVKFELLKYSGYIGKLNKQGLESVAKIDYSVEGVLFNKAKIKGTINRSGIDTQRIFTDIGVAFANGKISIKNTEQEIFDASYVSGVTGNDAYILWTAGHLLFKRYGTKNEIGGNIGDISGIRYLADAVSYIKKLYEKSGIVFLGGEDVVLYDRFAVDFVTSAEYTFNQNCGIGDPITLNYPNIAVNYTGIITDYKESPKSGEVSITAELLGEIIEQSVVYQYVETGDAEIEIIESGTRTINILEK